MATNGSGSHELVPGENEVIKRLSSYEDAELTKELYEFGSICSCREVTSAVVVV